MSKMRLSKRIYALSEAISPGERVADIGTDHGYVPMLLSRQNISPYVIMSDISEGSLAKAVETFDAVGLEISPEQFRVADGLEGISAGEVDAIIIAGLGGFTIANILDAEPAKSRSFSKIVMQPRKHSGNLRYYLYTHGYDIVDEILVPEGKFICEIIVARPSAVLERTTDIGEDDIRWQYPQSFAHVDTDCLRQRLDYKLASIDEQIENLHRSASDTTDAISILQSSRAYLEHLMQLNLDSSTKNVQ